MVEPSAWTAVGRPGSNERRNTRPLAAAVSREGAEGSTEGLTLRSYRRVHPPRGPVLHPEHRTRRFEAPRKSCEGGVEFDSSPTRLPRDEFPRLACPPRP